MAGKGVGSLGAEGPSVAIVARPNGYALETGMRLVMGGADRRAASRHGFAIARLDARLSFENAERNARREVPGRVGRVWGGLAVPGGGLAFRRIWETSGEGELLLRWVPRR
jgi:hypothetical protein